LSGAIVPPQPTDDLHPPGRDDEPVADVSPIRRRSDPPRQRSVFVEPDDEYEDEESGFSRFARGFSSVLSFGLYAALAGAAVLVFWNLRTGEATRPTATRIEASASSATVVAPVLEPSSSQPQAQVAETPRVSALPSLLTPPAAPLLAGEPTPSSTFGIPSSSVERELSNALSAPVLGASSEAMSIAPPADPVAAAASAEPSSGEASSSAEPLPAEPVQTASASAPLPFAMPPQMAAARARPAPRPTPPAPAVTTDTGL
jgi:hypothetical protein